MNDVTARAFQEIHRHPRVQTFGPTIPSPATAGISDSTTLAEFKYGGAETEVDVFLPVPIKGRKLLIKCALTQGATVQLVDPDGVDFSTPLATTASLLLTAGNELWFIESTDLADTVAASTAAISVLDGRCDDLVDKVAALEAYVPAVPALFADSAAVEALYVAEDYIVPDGTPFVLVESIEAVGTNALQITLPTGAEAVGKHIAVAVALTGGAKDTLDIILEDGVLTMSDVANGMYMFYCAGTGMWSRVTVPSDATLAGEASSADKAIIVLICDALAAAGIAVSTVTAAA